MRCKRKSSALVGLSFAAALVGVTERGHAQTPSADDDSEARLVPLLDQLSPRIVNGVPVAGLFPNVGMLARVNFATGAAEEICTGTVVGCSTFLTAAHCFDDSLVPSQYVVFLQHAGFFGVSSITRNSSYVASGTISPGDIAVVKLVTATTGIRPTPINAVGKPGPGLLGAIVGFGGIGGPSNPGLGIKRAGLVTTSNCPQPLSNSTHLCWEFSAPVGPPGEDSNTCGGDSGGPLFLNPGSGAVVAGVTSAGLSTSCTAPDLSWDVDVFANRVWIQAVAGADLNNTACGAIPQVFDANTEIRLADSHLDPTDAFEQWFVEVPPGASALRVAINGPLFTGQDFDLYLRRGAPPSVSPPLFDCSGIRSGVSFEYCEIPQPQAGTWWARVNRFAGSGDYQLTISILGGQAGPPTCVPSNTTLCIDDLPGDRRFKAQVFYQTTQGSMPSGFATPIPLADKGISAGGLFWFTNSTNPEVLLKVLKACSSNNHFWVFYSAGTNFGLAVTVTDTKTGRTWLSNNPDRTLAGSVADLQALPCN